MKSKEIKQTGNNDYRLFVWTMEDVQGEIQANVAVRFCPFLDESLSRYYCRLLLKAIAQFCKRRKKDKTVTLLQSIEDIFIRYGFKLQLFDYEIQGLAAAVFLPGDSLVESIGCLRAEPRKNRITILITDGNTSKTAHIFQLSEDTDEEQPTDEIPSSGDRLPNHCRPVNSWRSLLVRYPKLGKAGMYLLLVLAGLAAYYLLTLILNVIL